MQRLVVSVLTWIGSQISARADDSSGTIVKSGDNCVIQGYSTKPVVNDPRMVELVNLEYLGFGIGIVGLIICSWGATCVLSGMKEKNKSIEAGTKSMLKGIWLIGLGVALLAGFLYIELTVIAGRGC